MKKIVSALLALGMTVSMIGCSPSAPATTAAGTAAGTTAAGTAAATTTAATTTAVPKDLQVVNVGVAFYPMKDLLTLIQDDMKADGYDLKINEFTDYQAPNNLLKNKELDANMIQHDYFLQSFNKANSSDLVTVQPPLPRHLCDLRQGLQVCG